MKIEHIAIWTEDLETSKDFYVRYFGAVAGELYRNPKKQFESYFLSFSEGTRLEIMKRADVTANHNNQIEKVGLAHFAMSVGSKEKVDRLTEELRRADVVIVGEPRTTGDGYYESVVLDPDGNRVEITV